MVAGGNYNLAMPAIRFRCGPRRRIALSTAVLGQAFLSPPASSQIPLEEAHFTGFIEHVGRFEGRHVVLLTDGDANRVERLGADLDRLAAETIRLLAPTAPSQPFTQIRFHLFTDASIYRQTVSQYTSPGFKGTSLTLYHHAAASIEGIDDDQVRAMLQHEWIHQWLPRPIMDRNDHCPDGPTYSRAFDEGFAEAAESARVTTEGVDWSPVHTEYSDRVRAMIESGTLPSPSDLLAMDKKTYYGNRAANQPAAWAYFHFLLNGRDGRLRPVLSGFAAGLRAGRPAPDALQEALLTAGFTVDAFASECAGYFRALRPRVESSPDREAEVRRHVAGLGADSFDEREAAFEWLKEHFAAALSRLEEAVHCEDPEIRIRASSLLAHPSLPVYVHWWSAKDNERN